MKYYNFNGKKVRIAKEEYRCNGTLAVAMYTQGGELYDVITTNLNHPMQSDTMAFLDTNNIPGIEKFVIKNGLGLPMYFTAHSGFCEYPLYTLFV